MFFQLFSVHLQQRVAEHADGDVNQPFLNNWKAPVHLLKQLEGQLNIVLAVLGVGRQVFGGEILTPKPFGIGHLRAFGTQPEVLSQFGKTAAHLCAEHGTSHRQRIQPRLGLLAKDPRQDGRVKDCVMG